MIVKSYEVQKNASNFPKYNFFLLYGENFGLKKDIIDIIKAAVKQKNDSIEMLSLYETEIISNEKIFRQSADFYCGNVDMKVLPEGLSTYHKVQFIGRSSNKKNGHKLNLENIKVASNIFRFLYFVLKT